MKDKLIDREILFGNPQKIMVQISPNGQYISYIAPYKGVVNIWITSTDKKFNDKVVTYDNTRGIRSYFWSKNSEYIIYIQDTKGDENWCLYAVNIFSADVKSLTPDQNVKASLLKISDKFPHEILITLNARVPEYFDIYRVNIITGSLRMIYKNTGFYSSFIADDNFDIRIGYKMLATGEGQIYLFDSQNTESVSLMQEISVQDMLNTVPLHISTDNSKLFMLDSINRDTSALVEVNLISSMKKTIYQSSRADVDDYMVDSQTKMIQAVAIDYKRKEWIIIDRTIQQDMYYLSALDEGDIDVVSKNDLDNQWIVKYSKSNGPPRYYLYNRVLNKAELLFSSNELLEQEALATMYPVVIKSRDNLDLVCYITIPRWLDNGKGIPLQPVPMVLNVHGGPNARDRWGYRADTQWLANRGYATINVNYRGSTGFGKNFINAGDGEWSKKMQDDLEDAVTWAINRNIAIKNKIAIMGGSYGGYATLVGITMTPNLYVAGIDIVGPSNLETLLRSIPQYWKPHMAHLIKIIGASYNTAEGRKFLRERSPLTYTKNIKTPLLIVQGANDPRVKQAESDQIVEAMQKLSIPVVYLLYPDEGHGLVRPENKLSMYAHAEIFLANFVGGRFLPHDNNFFGSSIEVKAGKDMTWTQRVEENE